MPDDMSCTELKLTSDLLRIATDAADHKGVVDASIIFSGESSGDMKREAIGGAIYSKIVQWLARHPKLHSLLIASGGGAGLWGAIQGIPALMGTVASLPVGGLHGLWELIMNQVDPSERHEKPTPMKGIRRTDPRSDAKWWGRDIPSKAYDVPEYFHVEDSSYEPWYRKKLSEETPSFQREIGGIPQSFGPMIPDTIFSPYQQEPKDGPLPPGMKPPNAMDVYDQLTTRSPDATSRSPNASSSEDDAREVTAASFTSQRLDVPSDMASHAYSNFIFPDSEESAAAIGGPGGWYSPGSRSSPFYDPSGTHGANIPMSWEAKMGQTPLERNIARLRAMRQTEPQRVSFGTNWIVSNALAQLSKGIIDEDQAAKIIHGWAETARNMGMPEGVVENALRKGMAAIRSGRYAALPRRMFEGTPIPDYEAADWRALRNPHESRVRRPFMEEIEEKEEMLRDITPGYGSPLRGLL